MKKPLLFILISFSSFAQNLSGLWRIEMPTVTGMLPFHIEFQKNYNSWKAYTVNASEKLAFDKVILRSDSVFLDIEIFDAKLNLKIEGNTLHGVFRKRMSSMNFIEGRLKGKKGLSYRFIPPRTTSVRLASKYQLLFNDAGKMYDAVGVFSQNGSAVNGTMLTETGDYRYLQGEIVKDSLMLSCFEGNHVFLFKAKIKGDSLVSGTFCYNMKGLETWSGKVNPKAKLASAYALTYLKPGYKTLDFKFKNTAGETVSLSDEKYKGKAVIVQILGTWCPNCMDETKFLTQYHNNSKPANVEILGLAFEKSEEESWAFPKIKALETRLKVPYPILLAGTNDKAKAGTKLPMLNHVLSFPTTIFINTKGEVHKIHTGFSGPATGIYYEEFKKEFYQTVAEIIK
jgi:peroxiredoxin